MQSQQLCLFGAFRRGLAPYARAQAAKRSSRAYISRTNPLQRPATAAAQERDDDDEPIIRYQTAPERNSPLFRSGSARADAPRGVGDYSATNSRQPVRTTPDREAGPTSRYQPAGSNASSGLDSLLNSLGQTNPAPAWSTPRRDPQRQRTAVDSYGDQQPQLRFRRTGSHPSYSREPDSGSDRYSSRPAYSTSLNYADGAADRSRGRQAGMRRNDAALDLFQERSSNNDNYSRQSPRDFNGSYGRQNGRRRPEGEFGRRQEGGFSRRQEGGLGRRPETKEAEANPPEPETETSIDVEDYDLDPLDAVEDRVVDRRTYRASRADRYTTTAEPVQSVSEEAEKAQRAKERAKERELENVESIMEGESGRRRNRKKAKKAQPQVVQAPSRPTLKIPEFISVQHMAQALGLRLEPFIEKLEEEGFEGATYDHLLDSGTASMFADLYGYEPVLATVETQADLVARPPAEDTSLLPPRPPIVTIMGHVDHGKTTILDYLRKANVVASEHGGITQHIGAFSVVMPITEQRITFLDTPGHAAFLDMRRRGANVTDIVVLVVAADDSVMPQTKEAIKHALDANVQIIVAINKIDKPDADVEKVKNDLNGEGIEVEGRGGDIQAIELSGKTGQGMDALEEAIITLSEVSDFRAETTGAAEGWIIESKVTLAGRVATVLVRRGTLHVGDFIVAGNTWARVRTLRNDVGDLVSEAAPGTPVQIDGWRGEDPVAGLEVLQADDEQHAKDVVAIRLEKADALKTATDIVAINASRAEASEARAKVLEWQNEQGFRSKKQQRIRLRDTRTGWLDSGPEAGPRKVHFVVKADVAGSVEAIVAAVGAIGNHEVQANVIHSATGALSESDIRMLATSGEVSYGITFNQPILDYNVIYKLTDAVKEKVSAELPPLITTKVIGEAEVLQVFEVGKKNNKMRIAGCSISNGIVSRAQKVRVLRGDSEIFSGSLSGLKNVKKDVTEMRKGSECGMAFEAGRMP
ncbi:Translation initiation factor IF-2, mitochondrial [Cyphellophora attinorum]|uniref:Translation initiation factor IF-2, mitochondrial n=1 Tax=Cyphellophora attinorum TaxID=1664694 RepID=A0A0N1HA60_9EURO|nr:Translation initiation factor IF-2, mitochondrial [Phialophora attinorum]KPI44642.1 Translation initiation factor IF-2, mitochondrial [Phialophora attinorum]